MRFKWDFGYVQKKVFIMEFVFYWFVFGADDVEVGNFLVFEIIALFKTFKYFFYSLNFWVDIWTIWYLFFLVSLTNLLFFPIWTFIIDFIVTFIIIFLLFDPITFILFRVGGSMFFYKFLGNWVFILAVDFFCHCLIFSRFLGFYLLGHCYKFIFLFLFIVVFHQLLLRIFN